MLIFWCILYTETSCISIHYRAISAKTSFCKCLSSNRSIIPCLGHLAGTMGGRNFRRCWHTMRMERGNPETRGNQQLSRKYDDEWTSGLVPGTVLQVLWSSNCGTWVVWISWGTIWISDVPMLFPCGGTQKHSFISHITPNGALMRSPLHTFLCTTNSRISLYFFMCIYNRFYHNLYCSPNIIRMVKSRTMRWAGYLSSFRRRETHIWLGWECQKKKGH
jgi:hypothetical protein